MTVSQGIFKWMEENKDFFKPQGVCKKVGIDKGNFSRYKKDGAIPEKYLQPIMNLIMPLGFTLDEVIAENNTPKTKKKIEAARNTANSASQNPKNIETMSAMEKQFQELLNQKEDGKRKG